MTNIGELVDSFHEMEKEFQAKAQVLLKEAFASFFTENPGVKSILWVQYTPYFNDGDECIFGVHEMNLSLVCDKISEVERDDTYGEGELFISSWNEPDDPEIKALMKKFSTFCKIINKIPTDVYKKVFGDHVMVLATSEGFQIEDHDHD